jgi:hypothetical protein
MIVNEGKLFFDDAKAAALVDAGAQWGLTTSAHTVVAGETLASLLAAAPEATFPGYSRVTISGPSSATIVGTQAVVGFTPPVFNNTDSSDHTFRGWFLYDPVSGRLIAADDLGAALTITAGGSYTLLPSLTDDQA